MTVMIGTLLICTPLTERLSTIRRSRGTLREENSLPLVLWTFQFRENYVIDLILFAGRVLLVVLLYIFLFSSRTGIGLVRGQRKDGAIWSVDVEKGVKSLRGLQCRYLGPVVIGRFLLLLTLQTRTLRFCITCPLLPSRTRSA